MTIDKLVALATEKPRNSRWLGIDLGSKKIGFAITDPNLMIASPFETMNRKKIFERSTGFPKSNKRLSYKQFDIWASTNMDGKEGRRAQATRDFALNLSHYIPCPIVFWDERLSTAAVMRIMINEADLSRKRRTRSVDKMAAAFILQGALDALRNHLLKKRNPLESWMPARKTTYLFYYTCQLGCSAVIKCF